MYEDEEQSLSSRLETLLSNQVSREEILRQLNERKPGLRKGEVLEKATVLVSQAGSKEKLANAHDFLKGIIPLERSYVTSAGPVGTTREEVTVWDHPEKPLRMVPLMVFGVLGGLAYVVYLGGVGAWPILAIIAFASFPIVGMERAIVWNKWEARQKLDEDILQCAGHFESMLAEIYRE